MAQVVEKLAIINEKADVLGYGFEEYEIFTEKPGWSEHNADEYWKVACRVIKMLYPSQR